MTMINKSIVHEALKNSLDKIKDPVRTGSKPVDDQSSVTSYLIHDIFGGEILKTPKKSGWHFYNRIDGERIDFTGTESVTQTEDNRFEDIPSNTDEIHHYFAFEDYTAFFIRFIRVFEESVGLDKFRAGLSV